LGQYVASVELLHTPFLELPLIRSAAPWLALYPSLYKPEVAKAHAPKLSDQFFEQAQVRHYCEFAELVDEIY
jgi:hypothetical protein